MHLDPAVLEETENYAVLYKPPLMHSAPLGAQDSDAQDSDAQDSDAQGSDAQDIHVQDTLLDWFAGRYPKVRELKGKKPIEGGLLHRLDFETEGLVLFAKTQASLEYLSARQEAGDFVKDYRALTCHNPSPLEGFPPPPAAGDSGDEGLAGTRIESFFRPWGPGRKAVRPVISMLSGKRKGNLARNAGGFYVTTVLGVETRGHLRVFTLRISRGFRHQIRCHLAWIGEPILNDLLYGGQSAASGEKLPIALRAEAFSFYDPATGEEKFYRMPPLVSGEDMFTNFRG
jgi:23S rRNA pseudouridine1911/1915/1917 synthase